MEALEVLKNSLDGAQTELVHAELALTEATARAEDARNEYQKLRSAVAVLSGEPLPAANQTTISTQNGNKDTQIDPSSDPEPQTSPERAAMHELTPEEFDAQRKRRQRQRQKEEQANNPYAHIKCSGCGQKGTLQDVVMQAPSGAPVRMMTCSSCGNQIIQ